jgi:hypothetical protein
MSFLTGSPTRAPALGILKVERYIPLHRLGPFRPEIPITVICGRSPHAGSPLSNNLITASSGSRSVNSAAMQCNFALSLLSAQAASKGNIPLVWERARMLKNRQRIVRQVGRAHSEALAAKQIRQAVRENKVRSAAHRPNYCAQKSQ